MFIGRYKPTSPARRWAMSIKGYLLRAPFSNKVNNVQNVKQGEVKKYKRSRRVGPSQKVENLTAYGSLSRQFIISGVLKNSRNAKLKLIMRDCYGSLRYQAAHCGLKYGTIVKFKTKHLTNHTHQRLGSSFQLGQFSTGSVAFRLAVTGRKLMHFASAPGTYCKILWHQTRERITALQIPSKKLMKINWNSTAILGRSAVANKNKMVVGSAGKNMLKYKKTKSVRGVAKNPVDHPNGGRANTKQPLKNPWGRIAKKNK